MLARRHVRRDDLPHELVVDTKVAVDEAIAHPGHASPVDLVMPLAKLVGDPLGGLADDLKAPSERAPEVFVSQEGIAVGSPAASEQVVNLRLDVAQELTRLEGHRQPRPGCAARCAG